MPNDEKQLNEKERMEARIHNLEVMVHMMGAMLTDKETTRDEKERRLQRGMEKHFDKSTRHGGFWEVEFK